MICVANAFLVQMVTKIDLVMQKCSSFLIKLGLSPFRVCPVKGPNLNHYIVLSTFLQIPRCSCDVYCIMYMMTVAQVVADRLRDHDRELMPLCCCLLEGITFKSDTPISTHCQAQDSIEGKVNNFLNKYFLFYYKKYFWIVHKSMIHKVLSKYLSSNIFLYIFI